MLATAAAGAATVCLPWQPGAPLAVALVVAVTVSISLVAAAVLAERVAARVPVAGAGARVAVATPDQRSQSTLPSGGGERLRAAASTALVVASGSVVVAVLAAWASRETSVPVTAFAAAALLAARLRWRSLGPVLLAGAAVAVLVCTAAAGRWAGLSPGDAALAAVTAGGLVGLAAVLAPTLTVSERRALLVTGLLPLVGTAAVLPLVAAGSSLTTPELDVLLVPRPQLLLLAALVASVVLALRPGRRLPVHDSLIGAGLATALGCGLAASVASAWGAVPVPLSVAAAVAAAAVVAASAGHALDARRRPVEAVAAVCAVVVLLSLLLDDLAAAWGPLFVLAGAAAVITTTADRRWCGWLTLALATSGLWVRLADGSVAAVEAYSLPPAAALLLAASVGWVRGRGPLTPAGVGGAALALLPTAVVGSTGSTWRSVVVLAVGAALLAAEPPLTRQRVGGHTGAAAGQPPLTQDPRWTDLARLCAGSAVVALLVGPWARGLRRSAGPVDDVSGFAEWWVLPVTAVLAVAVPLVPRLLPDRSRLVAWSVVPALAALTLPVLVALFTEHVPTPEPAALQPARVLAVVTVGGTLAALAAARRLPQVGTVTQVAGLAAAVLAVLTGLGAGVATAGRPVELLTVPLAAAVLATGAAQMRRQDALSSWPWTGTGTVALLVPSLLLSVTQSTPSRVVLLAAAGTGVLVAGSVLRWQAPVVVGSLVLVAHAAVQLGPWIALAYATAPRWVSLGLAGALLLSLGARYEHRLRDLRTARMRLGSLR